MIVYKTTNNLLGKCFISKDANNLRSYLGSGKALPNAVNNHGKENFEKNTLENDSIELLSNGMSIDGKRFWSYKEDNL